MPFIAQDRVHLSRGASLLCRFFCLRLQWEDKNSACTKRQNADEIHWYREHPEFGKFLFPHSEDHGWHSVNRHIAAIPARNHHRNRGSGRVKPKASTGGNGDGGKNIY